MENDLNNANVEGIDNVVFPFQDKNKPQRSAEQQRFVEDFLCSTRLPAQLSVKEFSFFSQEELVSHIAKTMRMKHDWFAANGKVIGLGRPLTA